MHDAAALWNSWMFVVAGLDGVDGLVTTTFVALKFINA